MSIVIIGGHDRMVTQYKDLCNKYQCRAKVFTQMKGPLKKKLGSPDLFVLFTGTVSHKMVNCAISEAKRCEASIARSHTCSLNALREILEIYCVSCPNKDFCSNYQNH
ncbi:DUF2325 domain-containing protein [Eubacteriaceae bacterium ES3]|nr:DUF2325 domain-containing protein [Eubacteriaceae bacterium ES3]